MVITLKLVATLLLLIYSSLVLVATSEATPKTVIYNYVNNKKFINVKSVVKNGISHSHCLWECLNLPKCDSACFNKEEQLCFLNHAVNRIYKNQMITSSKGWLFFEKTEEHQQTEEPLPPEEFEFYIEGEMPLRRELEWRFPLQTKSWVVSFEFYIPTLYSDWRRLFFVSKGNDTHKSVYGGRNPYFVISPNSNNLVVTFAIDGNRNRVFKTGIPLSLNIYISVEVKQTFIPPDVYQQTTIFNGEIVDQVSNSESRVFSDMYIHIGNAKFQGSNATIRNPRYRNIVG